MNQALYGAMMKLNGKKIAKLSAGIILYEGLLTGVYPVVLKNPAVTQIAESIPSTVKTIFGVSEEARMDTFEAFISGQFFARIWVMLMALYNVETAKDLIAKMVDDGTIAFFLSTPIPREEFFSNQALVLLSGNAVLVTSALLGIYGGTHRAGISINRWQYLRFGLLGFAFYTFIGAYSLLFSAMCSEEDVAITLASGLTLGYYALDVVGGLSTKLSWARDLSLFRFYQPQEMLEGSVDPSSKIIGLGAGGIFFLWLGMKIFARRDLAI